MAKFTISQIKAFFKKDGFAKFVIDFLKAVIGQDAAAIRTSLRDNIVDDDVKPSVNELLMYDNSKGKKYLGNTIARAIVSKDDDTPASKGFVNMFCIINEIDMPPDGFLEDFDGYFDKPVLIKRKRFEPEPEAEEDAEAEPEDAEPEDAEPEDAKPEDAEPEDAEPEDEERPLKQARKTEERPIVSDIKESPFASSEQTVSFEAAPDTESVTDEKVVESCIERSVAIEQAC